MVGIFAPLAPTARVLERQSAGLPGVVQPTRTCDVGEQLSTGHRSLLHQQGRADLSGAKHLLRGQGERLQQQRSWPI